VNDKNDPNLGCNLSLSPCFSISTPPPIPKVKNLYLKDGRIASTSPVEISNIKDILPTKYVWVPKLEEGQTKCINTPQIGFTAKLQYDIIYADGQTKEKTFTSRYKPLQRVCYIVGDEIKTFDIKKMLKQ
jgi:hypothetical protein